MSAAHPPRSRGVIALLADNCTVCMICARECPDWCIEIAGHAETAAPPGSGRPKTENVLDGFTIDYSLCMYCGICIDACPFDALFWAPENAYPAPGRGELRHDRARLGGWMAAVPPREPGPGG